MRSSLRQQDPLPPCPPRKKSAHHTVWEVTLPPASRSASICPIAKTQTQPNKATQRKPEQEQQNGSTCTTPKKQHRTLDAPLQPKPARNRESRSIFTKSLTQRGMEEGRNNESKTAAERNEVPTSGALKFGAVRYRTKNRGGCHLREAMTVLSFAPGAARAGKKSRNQPFYILRSVLRLE